MRIVALLVILLLVWAPLFLVGGFSAYLSVSGNSTWMAWALGALSYCGLFVLPVTCVLINAVIDGQK